MTISSSPQGPFDTGTIVTSDWLNWVSANLPKALDGTAGGDYQPVNPLRIGGGGIAIPDGSELVIEPGGDLLVEAGATLTVEGTTIYNAGVQINGDLDLNGNADISGTLNTHGLLTISAGATMPTGQTLIVQSGSILSIAGALDVENAANLNVKSGANLNIKNGGDIEIEGGGDINVQMGGTVTAASGATATIQSGATLSIAGTLALASGAIVTDAHASKRGETPVYDNNATGNITLDINTGSQQFILSAAPTANRTITLRQNTSPVPPEGYYFDITGFIDSTGFVIQIEREGASGTYVAFLGDGTIPSPWASSNLVASVRVQVVSGVWRLVRANGCAFHGGDA